MTMSVGSAESTDWKQGRTNGGERCRSEKLSPHLRIIIRVTSVAHGNLVIFAG